MRNSGFSQMVKQLVNEQVQEELRSYFGDIGGGEKVRHISRKRFEKNEAAQETSNTGKKAGRPKKSQPTCSVHGCQNPQRTKGYCSKHYQAARNHKWPVPATKDFRPQMKEGPRGRAVYV